MTFVRTPATPRKPFGSALSSLGPPFPPFGLPANQESVHSYLESSTFWNPAQQGGSGDSAEDFKATPLRIWGGSVVDVLITSLVVIRISWAAGYLEIRNFTTGNTAACAAGQHSGRPGARSGTARQHPATAAATAAATRRSYAAAGGPPRAAAAPAAARQQKQRVSAGFSCGFFFGRGLLGPVAFVAGPPVSVCWRTWQEEQRQATTRAAPVAALKETGRSTSGNPVCWPTSPWLRATPPRPLQAGPGNTQKQRQGDTTTTRHRGCRGRRRTTQREHRHRRQPPAAPAHAEQAGQAPDRRQRQRTEEQADPGGQPQQRLRTESSQAPDLRQQKQRSCADSLEFLFFGERVVETVAPVAGGRCPLCAGGAAV